MRGKRLISHIGLIKVILWPSQHTNCGDKHDDKTHCYKRNTWRFVWFDILNGHLWRCMYKNLSKEMWFSVFQQCVFLSCLSTHIVCYFLLILLSYFWFTTHGFGYYRKFRNSQSCDPDFAHENSPSCFTSILILYGKYPRKACHVIRLLAQELSKINLRGITLEVIPPWRINSPFLS